MPERIETKWCAIPEDFSESAMIIESEPKYEPSAISYMTLIPPSREAWVVPEYIPVRKELLDSLSVLMGMGEVVKSIDARVKTLEDRMSMMEQKYYDELTKELPIGAVIETVEIPKKEARKAILKLFEQKKEIDYDAIVSELGLDLELVVEICSELEREKIIKEIK